MPPGPEKRCANCGALLPAGQTTDGRTLRCASCGAVAATYETVRERNAANKTAAPQETQRGPAGSDSSGGEPPTIGERTPKNAAFDTSLDLPASDADVAGPLDSPTAAYRLTASGTEPLSGSLSSGPMPAPRQIGRFCVLSTLGHGAFGNVYRAFDPLLDREVALKVPRFLGDDLALRVRFMREAKAAARLRHPNIVAIFECGHADDSPYIAAEFVDGVTLSKVLRERRLDTRTAVDWVRQIAEALHYAHSEGVIHRDIKPANIMVSKAGRPQVMDFGLSKRIADESAQLSVEGQVIGTPAYMAPEQAKGNLAAIGPHSDQYGVGVVLYQMLCGRTPYQGDALSVMSQLIDDRTAPTPPRSIRADVPRDLEACCLKAMEKDPAARYPSLQAFADDLKSWLDGRPLTARPIGVSEQLMRWCRKNRAIASLIAILAALVVAIAIVGYIMAFQFKDLANTATREANAARQSREQEKAARLATEQLLIDTYTEAGLAADRNGDAREAILWFANAAARAENHPLREKHNRMRVQSWLAEIAVPVHAFEPRGNWNEALLFHPSGRYLLSRSNAPACEIRDLRDGKVVSLPMERAHGGLWSPDGRWLALAVEQRVAVFEFPQGREIAGWTHPDWVTALAFSPDGKRLAVGGHKSARVRDVLEESFVTPSLEHGDRVLALVFNRAGDRLATGCADRMIRVFEVRPGASAESILPPQPSMNEGKDVPPLFVGANRLVVANSEGRVRCWNVESKQLEWAYPSSDDKERKASRTLCMTPSPKGDVLAVGNHSDVVFLDAAAGKQVGNRVQHRNLVTDVAFHPGGELLLSGSTDQTARLSRAPSGETVISVIPHHDTAHRCAWSPEGSVFATVHWGDHLIRVWKFGRPDARDFTLATASQRVFLKASRDGKYLLPGGIDTTRDSQPLQVYDAATGAVVGKPISAPGPISDAAFVPGTSLAVIAAAAMPQAGTDVRKQNLDQSGVVRFVDFQTGAMPLPDVVTPSDPLAVECSPDGRTVVALCHRGEVLIVDAATGKVSHKHQAFEGAAADFGYIIRDRIRFASAGDRFAIWGAGRRVEMRDGSSGELLFTVEHQRPFIHDVRFSPDDNTLATCSSDMNVCLWDARKGGTARHTLPHSDWVFTAQFSRDGKRLLTASRDRQARIWDVDAGQMLVATPAQRDEVQGVCFCPDEEVFLIGTRDGNISAWDSTLGKMVAPCRRLRDVVNQLTLTGDPVHVVATGRPRPIPAFDLADWVRAADPSLSRDDLRRLGEILSAQWIHEGGAATGLSRGEWLERWRDFRAKNPGHPALGMPARSD